MVSPRKSSCLREEKRDLRCFCFRVLLSFRLSRLRPKEKCSSMPHIVQTLSMQKQKKTETNTTPASSFPSRLLSSAFTKQKPV